MSLAREHRPHPAPLDNVGYCRGIGRHHDVSQHPVLQHTFENPDDERLTSQKLKRFMGEAG